MWSQCQGMCSSPFPGTQFFLLCNGLLALWLLFLGVVIPLLPLPKSLLPISNAQALGPASWHPFICSYSVVLKGQPSETLHGELHVCSLPYLISSWNGNEILGWKYFLNGLGHCLSSTGGLWGESSMLPCSERMASSW